MEPHIKCDLPSTPVKQSIYSSILLLTLYTQHRLTPNYITDLPHEQRATLGVRSTAKPLQA